MTEQGSPPRRSARQPDLGRRGYDRQPSSDRPRTDRPRPERLARGERRDRPGRWDEYGAFGPDTDAELPPWAGPSVHPVRPGSTRLRQRPAGDYEGVDRTDPWDGEEAPQWPDEEPPAPDPAARPATGRRSGRRAAAARLRKSRRRVLRWCGIAIVVCVVAAGIAAIVTHKSPSRLPYVTSLLKGEFKSVPNACTVLPAATLGQYLPGSHTQVQSADSSADSECSFTADKRPNFLVLTVGAQSFQPFAAASGNGSASQTALDNYIGARGLLLQPPKHSPLPRASITNLSGLGQHAYLAIQLEHIGGIARDVATVSVLYRNAIVTVSMSAQESGGYGPVAIGTLQADAQAVARSVLQKVQAGPTA